MTQKKIAVVGAGISGLSAAWLLSQRHDVTLFEQDPRAGGHANTVIAQLPDGPCAVDTGFIVYNTGCYPNLIALFEHLEVDTAPTSMSFSVSIDDGAYEYSGGGLRGLFGQRSNLLRLSHWRMVQEIFRFFQEADQFAHAARDPGLTLGEWLDQRGYSRGFVDRHIVPMGAAIWSTPADKMLGYPAAAFARFFRNHGLLRVTGRPSWRTVRGGSSNYVDAMLRTFRGEAHFGEGAVGISRQADGVRVRTTQGREMTFDDCVLACHGDAAFSLLEDADDAERSCLEAFSYSDNEAVLHLDRRWMPRRRALWSSWNYLSSNSDENVCLTYWMNKLQPLSTGHDVFVTLNPGGEAAPRDVLARFHYRHPMFDRGAIEAQSRLWDLQGRRNTWFAGSYFGYGFHEDGLQAGLAVAEQLGGVSRPWSVPGMNDRLVRGDVFHGEPLERARAA